MTENVIISIKGKQLFEDQEPDVTELVTPGTLEHDPVEGYKLSYAESELTGLEGTQTVFRIQGNQVTLTREGGVNSMMVFEEGTRHLSMYETPFGALSVGVNTKHMRADLSPSGGEIEIDYAIEVDHAVTGQNFFQIHIQQVPKFKQ